MQEIRRLFVEKKPEFAMEARHLLQDLRDNLGVRALTGLRLVMRYDVEGVSTQEFEAARWVVFAKVPLDVVFDETLPLALDERALAVEKLPGEYDQWADSARQCLQGLSHSARPCVAAARVYVLQGAITEGEFERIRSHLINPVDSREAADAKVSKRFADDSGRAFDIAISWSVTNLCNFSCYGCSAYSEKVDIDHNAVNIDLEGLKKTLNGLDQTVKITFSGGEPFIVENIVDVFVEVTAKNYMSLITNLTHPRVREFAERIDPRRVIYVKASAHISQLEKFKLLDVYADHYNLLKGKGFNMVVEEIAYPNLVDKVEKYKKIFQDKGIDLKFQAFRGIWKGKKYPDSYTDEEHKIFNFEDIAASPVEMHYRKGKKCNAGYNAFAAYPDGTIHRCYGISEKLGKIYNGFKMDKTLIECPLEYCDCPVPVFESQLFEKAVYET